MSSDSTPDTDPTTPWDSLREEWQGKLGSIATWEQSGQLPAFRVAPGDLRPACRTLRDGGFDYLLFMTASDYPEANRFELVYVLTNYAGGRELALVTDVERDNPSIETVCEIWPAADWHEREVFDMFGIEFREHPDLRRILLDDDWQGHPLRKDYVDTMHEMIKRPY